MGVHDSGYKHLFSFRAMVADLLRGFIDDQWIEEVDFESLERQNQSFVTDNLREREDDVIWRAKWKGRDRWMYIYFLIEFQTEPDKYMALRMINYVSLLYQDIVNSGELSGEALPPVLPMVVYRGERRWRSAMSIHDLIDSPPPGLSQYLPSMKYLLLEEVILNDEELAAMSNLAAELFRIENSASLRACIPPFLSFLKWTERTGGEQADLRRAVKAWFTRAQKPAKLTDENALSDLSPEEMEPMLSERIEQWSKELVEQGRAEGEAEGVRKGHVEVARAMLARGVPIADISEFTGLSPEELQLLAEPISH